MVIIRKILSFVAMLIVLCALCCASSVSAETLTFEGKGEYLLSDETVEYAKRVAKKEAMRDIARQVCIQMQTETNVEDITLDFDEITGDTESILHITDVKYNLKPEDDNIIVCATVKAEVDTDEIDKVLDKSTNNS